MIVSREKSIMRIMILFHDFELFLYSQCDNLKDLGVKCLFISDNDGTGTREVYGHPSAVWFAESSQLAAKLFAFLNGEGICQSKIIISPQLCSNAY